MALLLIVEDDLTMLDVLRDLLSAEHRCDTAATAEEAVTLMSSCDYDVIVTVLLMSGMGGEPLLGFAKTNCPGTPVVFISGQKDKGRARQLKVKGAFDYL